MYPTMDSIGSSDGSTLYTMDCIAGEHEVRPYSIVCHRRDVQRYIIPRKRVNSYMREAAEGRRQKSDNTGDPCCAIDQRRNTAPKPFGSCSKYSKQLVEQTRMVFRCFRCRAEHAATSENDVDDECNVVCSRFSPPSLPLALQPRLKSSQRPP